MGKKDSQGTGDAATRASAEWRLAGHAVRVTHLDKVYWPQTGTTKGDMLVYYRRIAPVLLPHLRNRPVTLRLYPDGASGPSYYQRERPSRAPGWLRGVTYRPKSAAHAVDLLLLDDAAGLMWAANAGAIEVHAWGSSVPDLDLADQAIFDLDLGDAVGFEGVLRAALRLRDLLAREGIAAYPKTSGGRSLHVVVPLISGPASSFDQVRSWVKAVTEQLHDACADVVPAHGATQHQGNQISIDYAQNSIGRNTAAPYTLRATYPHPVVSAPLAWTEVEAGGFHPAQFTPELVLDRVNHLGDLFAPLLHQSQRLPSVPTHDPTRPDCSW